MAGPAVGRLRTGRPGETKPQPKLVDALIGAPTDAGSIPAASTFPAITRKFRGGRLKRLVGCLVFFLLRSRERLERALQV
jgi:hypothetical protein